MKRLILFLSLIVLSSCSVLKQYSTEGFTTEENTVYYNGKAMAELSAIEYALDDGKLVKELTFNLLHGEDNGKINNLIAFLNTRYIGYEFEINIPMEGYKFEQ
jgi:hypothetical protein